MTQYYPQQRYQSRDYEVPTQVRTPARSIPPRQTTPSNDTNVATLERQLSVALGGGLVLYALLNRSSSSLLLGAVGAALVLHGQSQRSPIYDALQIDTARHQNGRQGSNGWQGNGRSEQRRPIVQEGRPMPSNTIEIERAVTVDKPAGELYNYWRKLENLPNFMAHLQEVKQTEGNQSHWVAKLAGGLPVSWDAEIVEDVPGERIVWRTVPGSTVEQQGRVAFKPATGERGTVVHVDIKYSPPGGIIGETFAQLLNGVTAQQVKDDIRRFKSLMETGEIPTVDGQPSGRR
ncbi:MAG TPA: SRPBCC family protein [Caldilineaceae bacterium]|nr:SRPBCC family protein [Caldilineaceae bacterium]